MIMGILSIKTTVIGALKNYFHQKKNIDNAYISDAVLAILKKLND